MQGLKELGMSDLLIWGGGAFPTKLAARAKALKRDEQG